MRSYPQQPQKTYPSALLVFFSFPLFLKSSFKRSFFPGELFDSQQPHQHSFICSPSPSIQNPSIHDSYAYKKINLLCVWCFYCDLIDWQNEISVMTMRMMIMISLTGKFYGLYHTLLKQHDLAILIYIIGCIVFNRIML